MRLHGGAFLQILLREDFLIGHPIMDPRKVKISSITVVRNVPARERIEKTKSTSPVKIFWIAAKMVDSI